MNLYGFPFLDRKINNDNIGITVRKTEKKLMLLCASASISLATLWQNGIILFSKDQNCKKSIWYSVTVHLQVIVILRYRFFDSLK